MSSATPNSAGEPVDQAELLRQWVADLSERVLAGGASGSAAPELEKHLDAILALAGTAAHAVVRPAAPLTTFVAGYAAGIAAAGGEPVAEAVVRATAAANEFALNWHRAPSADHADHADAEADSADAAARGERSE
jgi:hypothetical protein